MNLDNQEVRLNFKDDVVNFLRAQWCNEEVVACDGAATCEAQFESLLAWLATPPAFTTLRLNIRAHPDALQALRTELRQQYASRGHESPACDLHPQIKELAVIPSSGPHKPALEEKRVVVGVACGMAVLRGADVYAQGVVAAPPHLVVGDRVSVLADVEGAVCKGLTKPFSGRQLFVGNGVAEMGRSQIFAGGDKPTGLAVRMTCPLYVAPSLADLLPSTVFPQNLPSVVCSLVLGPRPGEHILDMCAAPGGKTIHIATLMNDQGRVVALDKSKGKIKTIVANAATWGLNSVLAFHFDSTKALDRAVDPPPADPPGTPPFPAETFHRVLLDAPCSALGQRPAVSNPMKLSEITSYAPLQRKLFTAAVGLLRPGGVLVYSTCTWTLEENEGLVAWALSSFPHLSLTPQVPHVGGSGRPGRGLSPAQLTLLQRFGPAAPDDPPCPDSDTIGFFCAKFVKHET